MSRFHQQSIACAPWHGIRETDDTGQTELLEAADDTRPRSNFHRSRGLCRAGPIEPELNLVAWQRRIFGDSYALRVLNLPGRAAIVGLCSVLRLRQA